MNKLPPDSEIPLLLARGAMSGGCPVMLTDREGVILYANPILCCLTGYTAEELQGKTPRHFKSHKTPLLVHQDLWQTITSGKAWHGEICNRRKNGQEYWESISISPIKDESGVITHFFAVWQDITVRRREDEEFHKEKEFLEKQSRTDDLTGLYNRRHIFIELEREVERASRYQRPLSGMMIDIDDFKKINDTYGHLTGDRLVRTFARLLESSVRAIDILGRYGGDEFLLILPETPLETARKVAERIRLNVIRYHRDVMGELGSLSVSIGLVEFDERCRSDRNLFLERIDAVLLSAKRAGKNQVVIG